MTTTKTKPKGNNFAQALRIARNFKRLSQEDFGLVSSRTYVSTLERGMKSPTLSKVDDLASVMSIHPLTLLTLSFLNDPVSESPASLLARVTDELIAMRAKESLRTFPIHVNGRMTSDDLRAWQAHMGFTYDTAAAALGVGRAAYADWIAGRSRVTKKPIQIDKKTALACAALAAGLPPLGSVIDKE